MAAATARLEVDVIADETCWSPHDALQVVAARAADAISVYVAKAGGIGAARLVGAIAATAGLATDMNGSIESGIGNAANVQVALASPSCSLASVIPISAPAGTHPYPIAGHYYDDDIIVEPFPVCSAELLALERPGLGVEVDEHKLAKFRTDGG
jgi:L-alanine-DL-glutamate epimerase-like enolase superfamily enzyme